MNNLSVQAIVNAAPVVAIVRRPKVDPIRCIEHLFQSGIRLVEITMDSANAVEIEIGGIPQWKTEAWSMSYHG